VISISSLILDNELVVKKHVESLAFNRGASSVGEIKAVDYIESELRSENIKAEFEYFDWTGPTRILMRTAYLILITYILLSRLLLVLIIYIIIKISFERFRKMSLIKKESSKNMYTRIPSINQDPNRPVVIFSAHYDSVSANIPYRLQYAIFLIYRFIIGFYIVVIGVLSIWLSLEIFQIYALPSNIIIIIALVSIIGIVIAIPILYLVFNEKPSSCSIDNASGVAILIELAKHFGRNPLENIDLYFVWTGAEEWGLKGAKKFCSDHIRHFHNEYNMEKSFNVNIDMVGTYIGLFDKYGFLIRRKLNKNLTDLFESTANSMNIPITRFNKIVEPKSDHKIFKKCPSKDLQVVYFHSDKDSKYIHSLRDTPDKCLKESLNGCLKICYQALRTYDLDLK
jgi:hypothetical protein